MIRHTPMSETVYEIRDLRLSFKDLAHKPIFGPAPEIEVLKGLSFDIAKGDVVGVVGGSGSGKSTLGRAMIRLLEPSAGSIRFQGRDITHLDEESLRPLRRKFQMIFEDPGISNFAIHMNCPVASARESGLPAQLQPNQSLFSPMKSSRAWMFHLRHMCLICLNNWCAIWG